MAELSKTDLIERNLRNELTIEILQIENQSNRHQGHSGDDGSGESHFFIQIRAEELEGLSRINQHKKIFESLGNDLVSSIHALSFKIL